MTAYRITCRTGKGQLANLIGWTGPGVVWISAGGAVGHLVRDGREYSRGALPWLTAEQVLAAARADALDVESVNKVDPEAYGPQWDDSADYMRAIGQ